MLLSALVASPAGAFELTGHETIEAAAYKRLLQLVVVPGTGTPGVSGRTLLATLIVTGDLEPPPCFDRMHPRGDCGPASRFALPLRHWPVLGSGSPDLVINRQLGQRGQCQHFMARTADGLTPVAARFGVPRDLVTVAYSRCIRIVGLVFDGILRDPRLASWRVAGTYALMHGIEDSFSAAHVNRDGQGAIVHLLSWKLIDLPRYLLGGHLAFPAATHHAISDGRDKDYLRWDAQTPDGRPCRTFQNPYAVPPECLTERGRAAVDAIVDYLVLLYRARTAARASADQATIMSPTSEARARWIEYAELHLHSATEAVEVPSEPESPPPLPSLFIGAQVSGGPNVRRVGLWASRFLLGPTLPFVFAPTLGVNYARESGHPRLGAAGGVAVFLPLAGRVAIGATPAGLFLSCGGAQTEPCSADVVARLGNLVIPLGHTTWLGVEGPVWSWNERRIGDTWGGLAFGWSHEQLPEPPEFAPDVIASWDPPRPEAVVAYRSSRTTQVVYLANTAGSTQQNQFLGVGLEARLDHDRWDHHAGFGPALQWEVDAGNIEGSGGGGTLGLAPIARYYLVRDRIAVSATPALVRIGTLAHQTFAADVAARAGIALDLSKIELSVDTPPLSYIAQSRWHALPITVRLGVLVN